MRLEFYKRIMINSVFFNGVSWHDSKCATTFWIHVCSFTFNNSSQSAAIAVRFVQPHFVNSSTSATASLLNCCWLLLFFIGHILCCFMDWLCRNKCHNWLYPVQHN